jgi:hypothetical protein
MRRSHRNPYFFEKDHRKNFIIGNISLVIKILFWVMAVWVLFLGLKNISDLMQERQNRKESNVVLEAN